MNRNIQNICKNIKNNISDKYSKKLPDTTKNYTTDAIKTVFKETTQKKLKQLVIS